MPVPSWSSVPLRPSLVGTWSALCYPAGSPHADGSGKGEVWEWEEGGVGVGGRCERERREVWDGEMGGEGGRCGREREVWEGKERSGRGGGRCGKLREHQTAKTLAS